MHPNNWLDNLRLRLQTQPSRRRHHRRPRRARAWGYRDPIATPVELLEVRCLLTTQLTGFVFEDLNGNRTHDADEVGIANRTVFVDVDESGTVSPGDHVTQTNALGAFNIQFDPGTNTQFQIAQAFDEEENPNAPQIAQSQQIVNVTDGSTSNVNFAIDTISLTSRVPPDDLFTLASESRKFQLGQVNGAIGSTVLTIDVDSVANPNVRNSTQRFLVIRQELFNQNPSFVELSVYQNGKLQTDRPPIAEDDGDQLILVLDGNESEFDIVAKPNENSRPGSEFVLSFNLVSNPEDRSRFGNRGGSQPMDIPAVDDEQPPGRISSTSGPLGIIGGLDFFEDIDAFQFTADESGFVLVKQTSDRTTELDTELFVINADAADELGFEELDDVIDNGVSLLTASFVEETVTIRNDDFGNGNDPAVVLQVGS